MELISVIVPALNRAGTIARQLECLAVQDIDRPFEVIVADNGSVDDTIAIARSFTNRFRRLRVIDASQTPGSAAARNIGINAADGALLAFCDDDDAAEPAWLREIIATLDAHEDSIVAGRTQFAFEGAPRSDASVWRPFVPRQRAFDFLRWGDTASMAIRRDDAQRIGGFDERFLRLCDMEFSFLAQIRRLELVESPAAMMWKYQPTDRAGRWRKLYEWGRFQPLLYEIYGPLGMRRRSGVAAGLGWLKLAGRSLLIFDRHQRAIVVRSSPEPAGRLVGSWRHRVWFP